MSRTRKTRHLLLSLSLLIVSFPTAFINPVKAQTLSSSPTILNREQAAPLVPPSVFYKGQIAPVQTRNSAGIRFSDATLVLAVLVDTSGYSSTVQETYQGYLITEKSLQIGDKTLAPGSYGFGFIANDRMVIMDVAANEILSTTTTRDPKLPRPNPLQILPDPGSSTRFRLYLGRSYVMLEAASK